MGMGGCKKGLTSVARPEAGNLATRSVVRIYVRPVTVCLLRVGSGGFVALTCLGSSWRS